MDTTCKIFSESDSLEIALCSMVKHPFSDVLEAASGGLDRDVLARGKCLQALAALRHTKWFQVCVFLTPCALVNRVKELLIDRYPPIQFGKRKRKKKPDIFMDYFF